MGLGGVKATRKREVERGACRVEREAPVEKMPCISKYTYIYIYLYIIWVPRARATRKLGGPMVEPMLFSTLLNGA